MMVGEWDPEKDGVAEVRSDGREAGVGSDGTVENAGGISGTGQYLVSGKSGSEYRVIRDRVAR